jgi:hypothetical protein
MDIRAIDLIASLTKQLVLMKKAIAQARELYEKHHENNLGSAL